MNQRPLALTDNPLQFIQHAARSLPVGQREGFLRGVARHLAAEPTDHAVSAAIDAELSLNRLPVFLCDGKLTKETTTMTKDDLDPFDERGILKDGHSSRISMTMRDSLRNNLRITAGDGTLDGLHRPGFRVASDASQRDGVKLALADYRDWVTTAWRGKDAGKGKIEPVSKITGTGSGEFRSEQQEGSVCTINGENGYIRNGVCVPGQPELKPIKLDANAHRSRMARVYDAYDREISNAWSMR
jgi:hypothetical protein